ncbi:MAG: hypothetical protein M3O31_08525 [Acidobacteriota bacterium]|nr:hypothetical protein [Acidobacteriota bacterium]
MLLETTGRVVHATTEPEQAEQIIREEHPDLLVLCYTLSPDDRSSILSAAQHLRPAMRTLILTADGTTETGQDDLSIFTGARALKAKVVEMLDWKQPEAD